MITYDDFKKVELKVVRVLEVSRVEGSEKLLKLKVDLGSDPSIASGRDQRQIVSGIAKAYEPEFLVGKNIVIVANLEPRTLMGLESQGMILAAHGESGPVILVPEKDVPPGADIS